MLIDNNVQVKMWRKMQNICIFATKLFIFRVMRRRLYIVFCLAVVLISMAMPTCASVSLHQEASERHDTLRDGSKKEHHRTAATFDDATSSLRLCLTRPSRLLPTTGSAPGKHSVRVNASLNATLLSNPLNYRLCRKEATPFPTTVSRDYYVIALRHIIC